MAKQISSIQPTRLSAGRCKGWNPTQATKELLASRECARPAATVNGLLRQFLAMCASCGEPGSQQMDQACLMMAFNDWVYFPPHPSDSVDLNKAEAILKKVMNGPRALPQPPCWPPEGTPAQVRNAMWVHLDLLGLRTLALWQCLGAGSSLGEFADPFSEFPLLVDLAGQFAQRRSWKRDDPDLQGIVHRMAEVLETCHKGLDRVEEVEGLRLPADLSWLRFHYPVRISDAAAPEASLSPTLQDELRAALKERGSARPLSTMVPLARLYGAWRHTNQPDWKWEPATDGRELAFMLFDTTADDPGPWTAAQARRFTTLSDRVFRLEEPAVPLPPFPGKQDEPGVEEALWRHVDHFSATFVLGLMAGGHLPSPPWPRNTPKEIKAHVEVATETLAQLHSLLNDWSTLRGRERQDALENVSGALAMFQGIHLGILEQVLTVHSTLLEPIRFPYAFEVSRPRGRSPRASRR